MADIRVYNTTASPVIYGDGQTIGGLEWANVDSNAVQEFIDFGTLIVVPAKKVAQTSVSTPVEKAIVEKIEEVSIDDSAETISDVSSDTAEEEISEGDTVTDAPSDATKNEVTPATIRKPRRRKSVTNERE